MKIHIVKQGDSLYALSQKYGVPLQKLIEANPQLSNPNVLTIGDKVKIPTAPVSVPENNEVYYKHTVKQGDTLWKLSKAWGIPLKDMIEANPQLKNPNVLLVGEVVNIPKKATSSPVHPNFAPSNASAKTEVGGKEFTGSKENTSTKENTGVKEDTSTKEQPAVVAKPEPNPAPVPKQEPVAVPIPLATPNVAPNLMPNLAPNPAPNLAPTQEMTPIEMQSLFVQITVPTQESVSYHEKMPKTEVKPMPCNEEKESTCDNSLGYPGLGGNPYFYDCPQEYSYQSSPNMNMNSAPTYVQPFTYTPDCMTPYYAGNMYAANSPEQWSNAAPNISPEYWNPNAAPNVSPEQWNPNAAPNYTEANVAGMNPAVDYAAYGVPQYGMQSSNLPWPSCGCGGGAHMQPIQPYSYEMPVYNSYPAYGNPNEFSGYGTGMPNQGIVPSSPLGAYGGPAISNIPPNPQYPGLGDFSHHNRVPEIQEPETITHDTPEVARAGLADSSTGDNSKESTTKGASSKVKTSSQNSKPNKSVAKSQRSKQGSRTEVAKRRRNPWISN